MYQVKSDRESIIFDSMCHSWTGADIHMCKICFIDFVYAGFLAIPCWDMNASFWL